jgi:hypothetical protein
MARKYLNNEKDRIDSSVHSPISPTPTPKQPTLPLPGSIFHQDLRIPGPTSQRGNKTRFVRRDGEAYMHLAAGGRKDGPADEQVLLRFGMVELALWGSKQWHIRKFWGEGGGRFIQMKR